MTEHVHDYQIMATIPYLDSHCRPFACCRDTDCDASLEKDEIDRRLNATEKLSAEQAMTFSFTIRQLARLVGEITEKASGDTRLLEFVNGGITEDQLQNYASALEKE